MAHIDAVNSRLAETQDELQKEIDALKRELSTNQDPEKMQMIQEMISVRYTIRILWVLTTYSSLRTYWVKCRVLGRRPRSLRLLSET